MKNFFVDLSKLTIAAILVLTLLIVAIIYMDVENMHLEPPRQVDAETIHAWLHDLEPKEEEEFTANYLQEICSSKANDDKTFCNGYMLGFIEGMDISKVIPICSSESLRSTKQSIQAFKNFMEENPEHWVKSRAPVLGAALRDAFPCEDHSTY